MHEIIGKKTSLKQLFQSMETIMKKNPFQLLLCGETGTGKSAIAQYIFTQTTKKNIACLEINCLNAEGNSFAETKDAILYFREIENLKPALQEKLWKIISSPYNTASVIASANTARLQKVLRSGKFHEDLYKKLSLIPFEVPPLRQRLNELPEYIALFIEMANKKYAKAVEGISAPALNLLSKYDFPGNISELKTIINHAVLLEETTLITAENICIRSKENTVSLSTEKAFNMYKRDGIRKLEAEYLEKLMIRHQGSVTSAATEAKLLRPALSRLLSNHNIKASDYKK